MIEQALYRALKAVNVGGVFAGARGDNLPAVVYSLISSPRTISITAQPQIINSRYQVDCYAASYGEAKAIAKAVIDHLHNQTQLDDTAVQRILLEDQRDQYEQTAEVHRQLLQFVIYHH